MNRAARVMEAANGGQIVCSEATAMLCPDAHFADAGEHRLRGIGTERLYFLVDDRYDLDARPLRSSSILPTNLPARLTSFVGREREVSELVEQVAAHRLVTLVGVGGVGKTSLASVTARTLLPKFPGGVWLCELASVTEPRSVPAVFAQAIGARLQPGMNLVDSIVDYLDERAALIIADNCEHLLGATRRLVERIIGNSATTILATSRAPLATSGEHVVAVAPLDPDSSGVALFVERARERNLRFSMSGDTVNAVQEICRRLDGLPLAIELAASRTVAMSPGMIVERLTDRFRLLRGRRTGDRHETLLDTLHWSYSLLGQSEATLFDRVSVFAGGFTLAAAEDVCSDDGTLDSVDVLDLLSALVDKSMVVADPAPHGDRYRLLETLRQYGIEHLQATGEHDIQLRRHARYYCRLAREQEPRLWSPAEPDVRRILDAEWDNLRAAFTYSTSDGDIDTAAELVGALGWYGAWSARDELPAGAEVLLALPEICAHPRFVDLCGIAAYGAFNRAELQRAIKLGERAHRTGRPDPSGLAYLATMAANVNLGDAAGVRANYEAWVNDAGASAPSIRSLPENMMGGFLARMHGSTAGDEYTKRGMKLALQGGCPSAISYAHMSRGHTLAITEPDQAVESFKTSAEIAESLDPRHNMIDFATRGLVELTARRGTIKETLRACHDGLITTLDHHKVIVTSNLLAPAAMALERFGNEPAAAALLGCLQAHGQRLVAAIETTSLDKRHPAEFEQGLALSVQQAAQLAIESVNAALSQLASEGCC